MKIKKISITISLVFCCFFANLLSIYAVSITDAGYRKNDNKIVVTVKIDNINNWNADKDKVVCTNTGATNAADKNKGYVLTFDKGNFNEQSSDKKYRNFTAKVDTNNFKWGEYSCVASVNGYNSAAFKAGFVFTDEITLMPFDDSLISEKINGYRFLKEGAVVSGETAVCGAKRYIEYCKTENNVDYCYYNLNGKEVKVYREKLVEREKSAGCGTVKTSDLPGYRFVAADDFENKFYKCGDRLYITECNDTYCNFTKVNTELGKSGKVSKSVLKSDTSEGKDYALAACNSSGVEHIEKDRWVTYDDKDGKFKCGDKLHITECIGNNCNYNRVEDKYIGIFIVDRTSLREKDTTAKDVCNISTEIKTCSGVNKENKGNTSSGTYSLCHDKKSTSEERNVLLEKNYLCDTDKGYIFDPTSIEAISQPDCNDSGTYCITNYKVSCKKANGVVAKPAVKVTPGYVGSNKKGTIAVTVTTFDGNDGGSYYVTESYLAPTASAKWVKFSGDSFNVEGEAGTKYIWVKDNEGNISYAVSAAILDPNNLDTTLKSVNIYDFTGQDKIPDAIAYNNSKIKSNKYVMMSNDLSKDSKVLADAFNPFDMEYKLNVEGPTLTVYATLTSTDAKYVDGYGPRTVNLDYGINTILIKVQDKEGSIRTYTILATRVDDRNSDNTLKELTVSEGKLEFNANVTEYKVEIDNNVKSVNIDSKIGSDLASYVDGFEPGKVTITGDTTVKFIKVKSQTGSTRTYVITFVKKGTDVVEDKSLQLFELKIPGVYLPFEEGVSNFNVTVGYETESINLNIVLKDKESSYIFRSKRKGEKDYKTGSVDGVALDVGENFLEIKVTNKEGKEAIYRITVIRKEFGLEISEDNTLKDLKVLGYDIKFKPEKRDYVVKIKQEKSLVITAVPNSNRAEVFIRGNDELTGFSTVRVKVVAENGDYETYSIDIKKDAFNKTIEVIAIIIGAVAIVSIGTVIVINKNRKAKKDYYKE